MKFKITYNLNEGEGDALNEGRRVTEEGIGTLSAYWGS